jgi:hypothetical protein
MPYEKKAPFCHLNYSKNDKMALTPANFSENNVRSAAGTAFE